jgi:hypothetical protein
VEPACGSLEPHGPNDCEWPDSAHAYHPDNVTSMGWSSMLERGLLTSHVARNRVMRSHRPIVL